MKRELEYSEEFKCWTGKITVKCDKELFNENSLELDVRINTTEKCLTAEYNAIEFLKENFTSIYECILKELYQWQEECNTKFEVYNEDKDNFSSIVFKDYKEIHAYMGIPTIQLTHENTKKKMAYIGMDFYKDCLLSAEHGLGAILFKDKMIDLDATDSDAIFYNLQFYDNPDNVLREKGMPGNRSLITLKNNMDNK